jgi:hypothetical protein
MANTITSTSPTLLKLILEFSEPEPVNTKSRYKYQKSNNIRISSQTSALYGMAVPNS